MTRVLCDGDIYERHKIIPGCGVSREREDPHDGDLLEGFAERVPMARNPVQVLVADEPGRVGITEGHEKL
jgi:hypothetical protein